MQQYLIKKGSTEVFVGSKMEVLKKLNLPYQNVLIGKYGEYKVEKCKYDYFYQGKKVISNQTIEDIAIKLLISPTTVRNWRYTHPKSLNHVEQHSL